MSNFVAECVQDGRPFALTPAHVRGELRQADDPPLSAAPDGFSPALCDYCTAKAVGLPTAEVVTIGLRQKTCPVCHTEFFSEG